LLSLIFRLAAAVYICICEFFVASTFWQNVGQLWRTWLLLGRSPRPRTLLSTSAYPPSLPPAILPLMTAICAVFVSCAYLLHLCCSS